MTIPRMRSETVAGTVPALASFWPASYRGRGLWIEPLGDGRCIGLAEGGYRTLPSADYQQILADLKAWIDRVTGGEVSA
jgi:hypothetical protein